MFAQSLPFLPLLPKPHEEGCENLSLLAKKIFPNSRSSLKEHSLNTMVPCTRPWLMLHGPSMSWILCQGPGFTDADSHMSLGQDPHGMCRLTDCHWGQISIVTHGRPLIVLWVCLSMRIVGSAYYLFFSRDTVSGSSLFWPCVVIMRHPKRVQEARHGAGVNAASSKKFLRETNGSQSSLLTSSWDDHERQGRKTLRTFPRTPPGEERHSDTSAPWKCHQSTGGQFHQSEHSVLLPQGTLWSA